MRTIVTESNRYPAKLFWSDEDEGFIAEAPDLPGCSAFGETQAEALTELQDAIAAWIEAATAAGNRIPGPSRPAMERHSGKVLLRMPRSLHAELAAAAKHNDVSLNQYIVFLIAGAHSQRQALKRIPISTAFVKSSSSSAHFWTHGIAQLGTAHSGDIVCTSSKRIGFESTDVSLVDPALVNWAQENG
jgi:predicted RNase H-like HicB family nuclease